MLITDGEVSPEEVDMSPDAAIGASASVIAVAALAADFFLGGLDFDSVGADADDVAGFTVGAILSLATASLLFGWVIPRSRSAPADRNRPARRALTTSIIGLLAVPFAWLGLVYVVAPAGVVLGQIGRQRSPQEGRNGIATSAVVIGLIAFAAGIYAVFSDIL